MSRFKYIIITAAKNEEKFIEKTIQSIISQTVLPVRWVIVDDGSTDSTAEIVNKYLKDYPFIRLVQREKSTERNFGNKVLAIRRGFEEVKDIDYEYYCNIDADVSFEPDYFEFLLKKFDKNPKLGICGGKVYDLIDGQFVIQKYREHSVAGPVQFFRRECYESFGGYLISEIGFIDGHAEISARMNGWITQTFNEKKVFHYKPVGFFKGSLLKRAIFGGELEYKFGYSYLYHIIRNSYKILEPPFIIGYFATLYGYLRAKFKSKDRVVSREFIKFLRNEQKNRLIHYIKKGK